jgi:hypothetical protein
MQHQFWDLHVDDDAFEVGLSFGGVPERLAVPFEAVTAFYDPAVQFGFQFETLEAAAAGERTATPIEKPAVPALPAEASKAGALPAPSATKGADPPPRPDGGSGGEVVRLDRFRKK